MTRNTRLSARYWAWVRRMGKKKALLALAHTLLRIIYHLLKDKNRYQELGADYLEKYRKDQEKRREAKMILELQAKGYSVALA